MIYTQAKKKIVVFEKLNFFNHILAIGYYKTGFDVWYFMIDNKIKESKYFNRVRKKFSINRIPEKQFDFNVWCSANERALNNVDLAFNSFFAASKSIKIMSSLFKSDLIDTVYKKIVLENLLSSYRAQIVLNTMVEDAALAQLYYVPSDFLYFINSVNSYSSFYILDRKIKIPRYSYLFNLFAVFVHKIKQFFLLAAWPFLLIREVKKIIPSNAEPKRYQTAIRIYKNGYNFNSEYRTIDFLLDGEKITKDNTLFCIETELDKDFREELARRKYHFVDIPNILRELSWNFIKKVYFAIILSVWLKLCIASILEPPFIVFSYRSVLGLYLRWSAFLDRYSIKNLVVYNDNSFTHILRNMLLSQRGVKTWYYAHSSHTPDLFTSPKVDKEIKCVPLSYLYYDNFVSWGKKVSDFFKNHPNNISNFINIGCLWSEHIKNIAEANGYSRMLTQIHKKYKQNGANINKKIIGVFDTSFGGETVVTAYDIKCFLEGILRLQEERNDIIFVVKLKNELRYLKENFTETFPYYEKIKKSANCYFLEDLHDPSLVNAVCDLNISACFTSTLNEAIGYRKKAIYFDAASRFIGYYYDRFPNLVAHGYDELVKLVDFWLYEIKDEGFSNYIDMYIKDELDPYTDGRAITRFRELLAK